MMMILVEKREKNKTYSWDEIYSAAINAAYGEAALKAKDEARYQVRQLILNHKNVDLENAEVPEDEVELYCRKYAILFDKCGNILLHKKIK